MCEITLEHHACLEGNLSVEQAPNEGDTMYAVCAGCGDYLEVEVEWVSSIYIALAWDDGYLRIIEHFEIDSSGVRTRFKLQYEKPVKNYPRRYAHPLL